MSIFFTYNDKLYKEGDTVIAPGNRSLRYGDGLFETLKVVKGRIRLGNYHFERLLSGMATLQFEVPKHFTPVYLQDKIAALCKKNDHNAVARVRLMIFRGDGGLFDPANHIPNYIIQTWSIQEDEGLNAHGLILDIYPGAKKSCDTLANLKSNNFLPYAMAALHAKQIKVNDCILLNNYDRICDSTIANIFIIKNDIIYTPPLSEGCIAGVMRRFIIEQLKGSAFQVIEKDISVADVENAGEIFLTNSIQSIRWVKQFGKIKYDNEQVKEINTIIREALRKEK
jgi:branched-chain amino acid aminotransferase